MKLFKHILFYLIAFATVQSSFAQFEIPEKPEFIPPVIDSTKTLKPNEYKLLYDKLKNYSDSTSTEIVIAIVATTHGENMDYYGTKWAHKWKIGQKNEDNGIFILLAINDRKVSIKTGYGVEHLLTDAMSKRIIERDIIPYFKQGDFYGGLNRGADAIFEVMTVEYQGTRQYESSDFPIGVGIFLFLLFIFIIFLIAISTGRRGGGKGGNKNNKNLIGKDILEAIIFSNSGRGIYKSSGGFGGFGGSSSSGSGSFGGFGSGGGFGGGGASGGW